MNSLLAKDGSDLHWRKERDCFMKCWKELVNQSKETVGDTGISHDDLCSKMTELISSDHFDEVIKRQTRNATQEKVSEEDK